MIPVNKPVISKEAKKNVIDALNTGWISSAGKYVEDFEKSFSKILKVKHAIAVCNGTAALHVALAALKIGKGDEVIVPAFTMASTWLAVIYTGAKPVFVDCEKHTLNIATSLIEEKITKRTKAILPVHIYGHPVDMDPIMRIAKKHGLYVIEDSAEAHGATYKKRLCGSIGDVGVFSFYANKIITTGEGGIVITNDDEIANRARKIKDLFHSPAKRFIHDDLGYNYRITNLQAAIGCGELLHLKEYVKKKIAMAAMYNKLLKGIRGLTLPICKEYAKNVYWMYGIRVDSKAFGISRDQLSLELKKRGVDTRDYFYPPDQQTVLKKYKIIKNNDRYPNAEKAGNNGLYLPSGLSITKREIAKVAKEIKNIHLSFLNKSL